MSTVESKLSELNIQLPDPVAPAGNYVPFLQQGSRILLSGQTCRQDGAMAYSGQVGGKLSVEEGKAAARICALNLLSQLRTSCGGDMDRVKRCIKLNIYVNSASSFSSQPAVANGASDLMVEIFGEKGVHVRSAVGVAALPGNAAVEVDGEFEILI
ncbi:RidA family protein [uncultured Oceanisphaera sp.]|uniref:RidA family protein n=1 Tax=uncultured Oceanisphaera sp. TaxID=353858 RepID=UPI0026363EED|nr:RidA family protein [uncultured Oceanisphaera sp.]